VILVDANLLIYAYDSASPFHEKARVWVEEVFSGSEPVKLAWITILAFLRISTAARAFAQPLKPAAAARVVHSWLELPQIGIIDPGEDFWEIYQTLIAEAQARGPLMTDAFLAALALEYGAFLCSSDEDFRRFGKLRFRNPLAKSQFQAS